MLSSCTWLKLHRFTPLSRNYTYPTPCHATWSICLTVSKCILTCVLVFHVTYSTPPHSTRHDVGNVCLFIQTSGPCVMSGGRTWPLTSGLLLMPPNAFSSHRSVYGCVCIERNGHIILNVQCTLDYPGADYPCMILSLIYCIFD
jgi:hypothetical protein